MDNISIKVYNLYIDINQKNKYPKQIFESANL